MMYVGLGNKNVPFPSSKQEICQIIQSTFAENLQMQQQLKMLQHRS